MYMIRRTCKYALTEQVIFRELLYDELFKDR